MKERKDVKVNDCIGIIDIDKEKVITIGEKIKKLSPQQEKRRYQIIKASFVDFFDNDDAENNN